MAKKEEILLNRIKILVEQKRKLQQENENPKITKSDLVYNFGRIDAIEARIDEVYRIANLLKVKFQDLVI